MKLSKLMLTMAVAASAFAACNKQDTTPVVENQPINKSIVINLANVMPATKGTGTTIADGTQVKLNSYQVFFVGQGGKLYAPKTETAEEYTDDAKGTYFNTGIVDNDEPAADMTHQFHFLPQDVHSVVVLGNAPKVTMTEGLTYDDVMDEVENLRIEDQQNPNDLLLYGMDASLEAMTGEYTHEGQQSGTNGEDVHPEPLFKAVVNLRPTVARFEVTGFQYAQVGEDERLFSKISVDNLSVINWHNAATVALADDAITVTASTVTGDDENPDLFFGGFYNDDTMYPEYLTQVAKTGWNFDAISTVELTEANPLSGVDPKAENYKDGVACYTYHVFPGASPRFIAELTGVNNVGGTDITTKMYLQTINNFAPAAGKIYRMCLTFTDTDLRAAEKCIKVEIHVADWDVEIITPTFGKNEATEE